MSEIRKDVPETGANGPAESCSIDPSGQGGKASECGTSLWKPPKFNLQFLFLFVTLAAIWFALQQVQNWGSMLVISVIMLTYMFGCPRTRNAVLTVVPAMYLPFSWLLGDHLSPVIHWSSFETWGEMPGLISGVFIVPYHTSYAIAWESLVPTGFTLLIFFGGVLPIRFSNISRWAFAIPLFALCAFFSFAAFTTFIE